MATRRAGEQASSLPAPDGDRATVESSSSTRFPAASRERSSRKTRPRKCPVNGWMLPLALPTGSACSAQGPIVNMPMTVVPSDS